MTLRPRTTAQTVIILNCCICQISTIYLQRVVDPGVTGDAAGTAEGVGVTPEPTVGAAGKVEVGMLTVAILFS